MAEYLEASADKFTFRVAVDRLYSADGIWVLGPEPKENNRIRVGLADYFQQHSGDVAFALVRPAGTKFPSGGEFAEIETVKTNVSLYSPVGGAIVEVNPALSLTPEIINQDPYGKGWLAVIEVENWEADRVRLLDPQAYLAVMRSQIEQELKQP